MINDSMKSNKITGMIQPKSLNNKYNVPELYEITPENNRFKETDDGRYLIELKGVIRFQVIKEIKSDKKYRILEVNCSQFYGDLIEKTRVKIFRFRVSFQRFKNLFEKEDS